MKTLFRHAFIAIIFLLHMSCVGINTAHILESIKPGASLEETYISDVTSDFPGLSKIKIFHAESSIRTPKDKRFQVYFIVKNSNREFFALSRNYSSFDEILSDDKYRMSDREFADSFCNLFSKVQHGSSFQIFNTEVAQSLGLGDGPLYSNSQKISDMKISKTSQSISYRYFIISRGLEVLMCDMTIHRDGRVIKYASKKI